MNNEETTSAVFVVSEDELRHAFMEASRNIVERDSKKDISPVLLMMNIVLSAELSIEVCKILKEKAENHEDSEH